jgi:hypothetical protein
MKIATNIPRDTASGLDCELEKEFFFVEVIPLCFVNNI